MSLIIFLGVKSGKEKDYLIYFSEKEDPELPQKQSHLDFVVYHLLIRE